MTTYDFSQYIGNSRKSDTGKTIFGGKSYRRFDTMESLIKKVENEFQDGNFQVNQKWRDQLPKIKNAVNMNPKMIAATYDIYAKTKFSFLYENIGKDNKLKPNIKKFNEIMDDVKHNFYPPLKNYDKMSFAELKKETEAEFQTRDELLKYLKENDIKYLRLRQDALVYCLVFNEMFIEFDENRVKRYQEDKESSDEEEEKEESEREDSDSDSEP